MSQYLGKYEKLIKNFFSLFILQGLNYLLPLLTIPYLTRILGPTNYGKTIFASSIIIFFQVISDYGFNLSATRNISINTENKRKVSEIYSNVLCIKFLLSIIGFLILIVLTSLIPRFNDDRTLYYITYFGVFGNSLFPIWLFQGLEEMSYITKLNIILKTISTVLLFVFIQNSNQYILVPLINSIILIIVAIYSLNFINRKLDIKFIRPTIKSMKKEIVDGKDIFVTTFFSAILSNIGNFCIGLFLGDTVVGYYGAINKITKAIVSMFSPIITAIYPFINKIITDNKRDGVKELIKFGKIIMLITCIVSMVTFCYSYFIIFILCGKNFLSYVDILKIESIWIIFTILNNLVGIQFLISIGYGNLYSRCFLIAGITMIVLSFTMIKLFGIYTISISMLISEILLTIFMFFVIIRRKLYR
ncbi:flippase [Turicibacter sanguinis]|uniref:flippase n=1 Tax=Turicibacter sanguinis TaxID=154288 RepID=UPI0018ABB26E|nr:flippase [Turicibacter sanguinis]MDB8564131.1 flippase [Turicibacter sanguinis]